MSDYLLPLHLTILGFTAVGILLADHQGFLWLSGKKPVLDKKYITKLHYWVALGLCGMIVTGFSMFWPLRDYLLNYSLPFLFKMFFVALLIANSFVIGAGFKVSSTRTYASLSTKEKLPLLLSGAISGASWIAAATLAFFLF
jgi:hypothetical protein